MRRFPLLLALLLAGALGATSVRALTSALEMGGGPTSGGGARVQSALGQGYSTETLQAGGFRIHGGLLAAVLRPAGGTPTPTPSPSPTPLATATPTLTPSATQDSCAFASGPSVSTSGDRAIVSWSTNLESTAEVLARSSPGFPLASDALLALGHRVEIPSLTPGTSYDYQAQSACPGVPTGVFRRGSFTTLPSAPPVLLEGPFPEFFSIGPSSAVLYWRTSTPADARVDFGTSSGYGSFGSLSLLLQTHDFLLTGLTPGSLYHFQVTSCDAFAQCVSSSDSSFRTTPFAGSSVPVLTEGPSLDSFDMTSEKAFIHWTTDEPSSSFVQYGTTPDVPLTAGSSLLTREHQVALENLTPGAAYFYRAFSVDDQENPVFSAIQSFTTQPADTEPPVLVSGPDLDLTYVSSDQMVLEWENDELAQAELVLTPEGARAEGVAVWISSGSGRKHVANVRGLRSNTLYRYSLRLTDAAGNSSLYQGPSLAPLQTLPAPDSTAPALAAVELVAAGSGRALLLATSDEASDTRVRILVDGEDSGYRVQDGLPVLAHQLDLTRLEVFGGAPFTVELTSCNPAGLCSAPNRTDFQLRPAATSGLPGQGSASSAPTLGNLEATPLDAWSLRLGWTSDEPSTSQLAFTPGIAGALAGSRLDLHSKTRAHSIVLPKLEPDSCYAVRVASTNASGQSASLSTVDVCTPPVLGLANAWTLLPLVSFLALGRLLRRRARRVRTPSRV